MELTQAIITPLVTTVLLLAAGYLFKERLDRLEAKQDQMQAQMVTRDEFSRLVAEVASLRSDLTQIALAVGAQLRPQTG